MEDIDRRVTRLEDRMTSIEKEQKEQKQSIKDISKLASGVEVMANEMKHMNQKIDNIGSKVELHHTEEPNKLMNSAKIAIVTGIIGIIIGAIFALILK